MESVDVVKIVMVIGTDHLVMQMSWLIVEDVVTTWLQNHIKVPR